MLFSWGFLSVLRNFNCLNLRHLSEGPRFPNGFLVDLPFLPAFTVGLPAFIQGKAGDFFGRSIRFFRLRQDVDHGDVSVFFSSLSKGHVLFVTWDVRTAVTYELRGVDLR